MIANGILLAFKELQVSVPVVVRIRGTNEKEGRRIVSLIHYLIPSEHYLTYITDRR